MPDYSQNEALETHTKIAVGVPDNSIVICCYGEFTPFPI